MSESVLKTLQKLISYWKSREVCEKERLYFLYEDMGLSSGRPFSARLAADIGLGYLVFGLLEEDDVILKKSVQILRYVLDQQHLSGAFEWNLPDPIAGPGNPVKDQVDLATVLDVYYYFSASGVMDGSLLQDVQRSTRRAIGYLRQHAITVYPGVIKKRDYGPAYSSTVDVLNGDAMVVAAYTRASQLLDDSALLNEAKPYLHNLLDRFGAHYPGWWPYSERLPDRADTSVQRPGISLFFQAMILLYLEPYYRITHNQQLESVMREGLLSLSTATSAYGTIQYAYESRQEFINRPNVMLPACMLALHDIMNCQPFISSRMKFITERLVTDDGIVYDDNGGQTGELWRIWLMSDLALYLLYSTQFGRGGEVCMNQ
ncbi:hypothetical protein M6D81_06810 [Paenibacillus sp. J5C_2022]|uniref:hypothetical protein n=1 Tax=Paenibacillus sp. J5C2022 TaxID=2977129 RepID=UPI0021D0E157|nr:hypothetical protein [Paenibacillus sp. J5C2022]MCU6708423.1 hypothetical protein [Paenibacillus sp. J5C2022]